MEKLFYRHVVDYVYYGIVSTGDESCRVVYISLEGGSSVHEWSEECAIGDAFDDSVMSLYVEIDGDEFAKAYRQAKNSIKDASSLLMFGV